MKIDELLEVKNHFPRELLDKINNAICFFTSAFYGQNDVIDLYRKKIKKVTLVDRDELKLEEMKKIYNMETWSYIVDDAYKAAERLAQGKVKYDLVVCDPWGGDDEKVLNCRWFYRLAGKFYVVTVTKKYFDKIGIEANLEEVKEKFPNTIGLMHRSNCGGGVYWLIMKGENQRKMIKV